MSSNLTFSIASLEALVSPTFRPILFVFFRALSISGAPLHKHVMAAAVRARARQRLPGIFLEKLYLQQTRGGLAATATGSGAYYREYTGFSLSGLGQAASNAILGRHDREVCVFHQSPHQGTRDGTYFSSLHTAAQYGSTWTPMNHSSGSRSLVEILKSFAVGGVRHKSVINKKLREVQVVQARLRRMRRKGFTDEVHNSMYSSSNNNGTQPPLSQPLLGSLKPTCPEEEKIAPVLARPDLLITRNVEWANLAFGFEQSPDKRLTASYEDVVNHHPLADFTSSPCPMCEHPILPQRELVQQNRYVIMDPRQPQAPVGYILEDSNIILRQVMRTRRPFVATVLDAYSNELFRVRRPMWLINSAIYVEIDGKVIGECHRRWHLWRRIYDVYLGSKQFATVENPGFWHWTFSLKDENGGTLAEIDRNWRGFGYEFLTDAGQYMIRYGDMMPEHDHQYTAAEKDLHSRRPLLATGDGHSGAQEMQRLQAAAEEAAPLEVSRSLTLSERAVGLALAVSLDNDYFSRHSHPGWGMPIPFIGSEASAA